MQDTPYKVKTQHEYKSSDVVWHEQGVSHHFRSQAKGHAPCVLWFTGLSGSGKSTIANAVDALLYQMGAHTYVLDGDNVRHGLNGDLGFSEQDRVENIRRLGEVANLFVDAGLIVLTAFISPFQADRAQARTKINRGRFIEVFIDTPLEICEARDPKGLYQKARRGEIKHFTGIDSAYEAPVNPELHIQTAHIDSLTCAEIIVNYLIEQRILQPA